MSLGVWGAQEWTIQEDEEEQHTARAIAASLAHVTGMDSIDNDGAESDELALAIAASLAVQPDDGNGADGWAAAHQSPASRNQGRDGSFGMDTRGEPNGTRVLAQGAALYPRDDEQDATPMDSEDNAGVALDGDGVDDDDDGGGCYNDSDADDDGVNSDSDDGEFWLPSPSDESDCDSDGNMDDDRMEQEDADAGVLECRRQRSGMHNARRVVAQTPRKLGRCPVALLCSQDTRPAQAMCDHLSSADLVHLALASEASLCAVAAVIAASGERASEGHVASSPPSLSLPISLRLSLARKTLKCLPRCHAILDIFEATFRANPPHRDRCERWRDLTRSDGARRVTLFAYRAAYCLEAWPRASLEKLIELAAEHDDEDLLRACRNASQRLNTFCRLVAGEALAFPSCSAHWCVGPGCGWFRRLASWIASAVKDPDERLQEGSMSVARCAELIGYASTYDVLTQAQLAGRTLSVPTFAEAWRAASDGSSVCAIRLVHSGHATMTLKRGWTHNALERAAVCGHLLHHAIASLPVGDTTMPAAGQNKNDDKTPATAKARNARGSCGAPVGDQVCQHDETLAGDTLRSILYGPDMSQHNPLFPTAPFLSSAGAGAKALFCAFLERLVLDCLVPMTVGVVRDWEDSTDTHLLRALGAVSSVCETLLRRAEKSQRALPAGHQSWSARVLARVLAAVAPVWPIHDTMRLWIATARARCFVGDAMVHHPAAGSLARRVVSQPTSSHAGRIASEASRGCADPMQPAPCCTDFVATVGQLNVVCKDLFGRVGLSDLWSLSLCSKGAIRLVASALLAPPDLDDDTRALVPGLLDSASVATVRVDRGSAVIAIETVAVPGHFESAIDVAPYIALACHALPVVEQAALGLIPTAQLVATSAQRHLTNATKARQHSLRWVSDKDPATQDRHADNTAKKQAVQAKLAAIIARADSLSLGSAIERAMRIAEATNPDWVDPPAQLFSEATRRAIGNADATWPAFALGLRRNKDSVRFLVEAQPTLAYRLAHEAGARRSRRLLGLACRIVAWPKPQPSASAAAAPATRQLRSNLSGMQPHAAVRLSRVVAWAMRGICQDAPLADDDRAAEVALFAELRLISSALVLAGDLSHYHRCVIAVSCLHAAFLSLVHAPDAHRQVWMERAQWFLDRAIAMA
jgi:hypothetical protein